jgi:GT2 family glycosyltransferase
MMAPPARPGRRGRNDPCTCGSGLRFKECCGSLQDGTPRAAVKPLMGAAMQAQRARNFRQAAELYRKTLALTPDEPDALHMLGVVCYELGENAEAHALILRALELTHWGFWSYRHNLGLVVARLVSESDRRRTVDTQARYRAWRTTPGTTGDGSSPKVAVVIPCYNHAAFIERALASVFAQTYRHVELVVIDDGSTDDSANAVQRALAHSPFPSRFVSRPNRGAATTINEGVTQSDAQYVNVLNSDDAFTADRLQAMVDNVAAQGFAWGFSEIDVIDADDQETDPLRDKLAFNALVLQGSIPIARTVGFAFLEANVAISSGNLFFSRALFDRVGGFRDFRYNHDWDFCLRALRFAEPRYVRVRTYRYRLHGANTIAENSSQARSEADHLQREYLEWATTTALSDSEWAPCVANWGEVFVIQLLGAGMAEVLVPQQLRTIVANLIGDAVAPAPPGRDASHEAPAASRGT